MKIPRISPQTLRVLERFAERPTAWCYGYELSRETGLKSGTLYPILMRLAKFSLLETKWVTTEDGVPPRHTSALLQKALSWFAAPSLQLPPRQNAAAPLSAEAAHDAPLLSPPRGRSPLPLRSLDRAA